MVRSISLRTVARNWCKEHVAASIVVFCTLIVAVVYGKVFFVDHNPAVIRWMQHQTVNDDGGAQQKEVAGPLRLPAKYQMINPLLLLVDYPVCRFLTFSVKLKDIPFVTANLVSLIHPCFGILAAYFIIKSASAAAPSGGAAGVAAPAASAADAAAAFPDFEEALDTEAFVQQNNPIELREDIESCYDDGSMAVPRPDAATLAAADAAPAGVQNVFYLRVAAALFVLRNTLDTLDGVVARAKKGDKNLATGVENGWFNGHTLDVVTDMTGVTIFMISVWYTHYKLRTKLDWHSLPGLKQVVEKLIGAGFSPLNVSRLLIGIGLAMMCLTGASWENTMLKMQIFFDKTSDPNLLALERTPAVQICYFLWAFTCSDTLFLYLIFAMVTRCTADWLVFLSVYGWAWLVCLSLYSNYVTATLAANPLLQTAKLGHSH